MLLTENFARPFVSLQAKKQNLKGMGRVFFLQLERKLLMFLSFQYKNTDSENWIILDRT